MCKRRFWVAEHWHNLRPEALAEYRVGKRPLRFWLEWDRGTMNVRDLTVKFTAYAHYIDSREWAIEGTRPLWLVCIVPDVAQEKRIQSVARNGLSHTSGLVVRTTTEMLLNEYVPLAPVWTR